MKNENGNTFIERLKFEKEIYELEEGRLYNIFKDSYTKYTNKRSLTDFKKLDIATEKWAKSLHKYSDVSRRLRNAEHGITSVLESPLRVV